MIRRRSRAERRLIRYIDRTVSRLRLTRVDWLARDLPTSAAFVAHKIVGLLIERDEAEARLREVIASD